MGSSGSGSGDVFDVRKIRRLVELMNDHDLGEVDLKQGDQRIRLRRGVDPVVTMPAVPAVAAPAPVAAAPAAAPSGGQPSAAAEDDNATYITSPMVGTFYSSANPESPPFVNVGDQVGPETVVCILEAMKVFNEIPAECSGSIATMLVADGDAIEYGQKLFKLAPAS
ncbi:MAG: acetyl-CoA carboxylase biotin carboxyl carrier protein [Planctomycetes bacterium]|nr:acetyl-CoA carboxylase biotin carboxyl carrier protein [Planctomycetota bacterium]